MKNAYVEAVKNIEALCSLYKEGTIIFDNSAEGVTDEIIRIIELVNMGGEV